MKIVFRNRRHAVRICAFILLVIGACGSFCVAQGSKFKQIAGVGVSRVGPYRALAQLSYQAYERGDIWTAVELARVLERTWEAGEERGGEKSLAKVNPELFRQIDSAVDHFVEPLIDYVLGQANELPDTVEFQRTFSDLIAKLKMAE
jgi:hypothetical protein